MLGNLLKALSDAIKAGDKKTARNRLWDLKRVGMDATTALILVNSNDLLEDLNNDN